MSSQQAASGEVDSDVTFLRWRRSAARPVVLPSSAVDTSGGVVVDQEANANVSDDTTGGHK